MIERSRKTVIWPFVCSGIIVLSLAVSLLSFAFSPNRREMRVLFFYNDISRKEASMALAMKKKSDLACDIRATLNFMLASPENIEWRPLFAAQAQLGQISVLSGIAYIDIVLDAASLAVDGVDFKGDAALLQRAVRFNFPQVEQAVVTFNGQEAYAVPFKL